MPLPQVPQRAPQSPAAAAGAPGVPPPLPQRRPTPASHPAAAAAAASEPVASQEEKTIAGAAGENAGEDGQPVFNYVTKPVDLKTILETDKDDESMNRYKAQLGLGSGPTCKFPDNPSHVVPVEVRICSPGRDPIRLRIDSPTVQHYVMKEGVEFWVELDFYAQHNIVSGLRFKNEVKRLMASDTTEEMLGSYPPSDKLHTVRVLEDEAPSGFLARGTYNAQATLRDDDREYLTLKYTFEIAKDWPH